MINRKSECYSCLLDVSDLLGVLELLWQRDKYCTHQLMKGIQWELLCFLKNNPISNHTDSRVRLWNHSIPAGNRSVEVLSVWNRMGESQCLFTLGPLGELWWGFVRCESHHHISHQPLTAAKHWLGLSMQASAQLGSIPYIFLKKVWSILGEESACYAGGEMGAALPALTSEQPPSTHSHPVSSLLLPRWESGQRIFPFALRKPMDGWCQPTVW